MIGQQVYNSQNLLYNCDMDLQLNIDERNKIALAKEKNRIKVRGNSLALKLYGMHYSTIGWLLKGETTQTRSITWTRVDEGKCLFKDKLHIL